MSELTKDALLGMHSNSILGVSPESLNSAGLPEYDIRDLVRLKKYVLFVEDPATYPQYDTATGFERDGVHYDANVLDFDIDGTYTDADVLLLKKYLLGVITVEELVGPMLNQQLATIIEEVEHTME